jgi:DNA-binding response OmpR family regulator
MLEAHREVFEREGFQVLACVDGETAFHLIVQDRIVPDVMVMEYHLHGMSGMNLLARIKDAIRQVIPTLLICDGLPPVTGFLLGVRGFLWKPVARKLLVKSVRDVIQGEVTEEERCLLEAS